MPAPDSDQWLAEQLAGFNRSQALLEATSAALYAKWSSWSASKTNISLGTGGTEKFHYRQIGEEMFVRMEIRFGSGGNVTGIDPRFTLPKPLLSGLAPYTLLGVGSMYLAGINTVLPLALTAYNTSTTTVVMYAWAATTSGFLNLDNGVPGTWSSGSSMNCSFSYLVTASY